MYVYMIFGLLLFLVWVSLFSSGVYFLMSDFLLFIDWELISFNTFSMVMTFLLVWMSLVFMGCVLFISSMVIFYKSSYMLGNLFKVRFLILVLLFILSMMLLTISKYQLD